MPDSMMDVAPRNRSSQINEIAAALAKAQATMSGAKRDSTNPHFRSSYADLESVWEAVRKPLTDNGLCIVQMPATVNDGVEIETILMHTSGQFLSNSLWVPCSKRDAQGIGSAITYGRRYALMAMAGISPTDDDGNAAMATVPSDAMQRQSSANGRRMAADEPHLVDASRPKGSLPAPANATTNGKKTAAEKAVDWTNKAIQMLNLTDHTSDSLSKFWSENAEKIEWLEANAPDQHERLLTAYDNTAEAARAKAGGA